MKKKVVVGMSGGVDSSVAAYLLKEQGYDVTGVTMRTWDEAGQTEDGEGCCGLSGAEDAGRVAQVLGIPHYVMNFKREFLEKVVDYFTSEYLRGRTPNPCIACNRYVKWESLLARSMEIGADYIATGHYARVEHLKNGRFAVRNSVTAKKDQTYALYNLTQFQLSHTLMPVGAYSKEEIRRIAEQNHIPVASKPDSQDICFVPDGDYAGFIRRSVPDKAPGPGNFVTPEGKVLGRHKGIIHYTVGQRKGLGLSMGHPVFVSGLRPETNEVVVSSSDVYQTSLVCNQINFMGMENLKEPRRLWTKVRYAHKGQWCLARQTGEDTVECVFEEPVRAVTPGQAVVFYEGEYVMGGGTIV
ncbi:MAG: tRNA 2-thiouridine(34) synthase MnmA [Lachnospiraceae bacterium]|nr:tRNA 2-thiouridine(34) synthase MnmA [Lachnospiraceae bacterium]